MATILVLDSKFAGAMVQWLNLPARRSSDRPRHAMAFKFQENKMFLPRSLLDF